MSGNLEINLIYILVNEYFIGCIGINGILIITIDENVELFGALSRREGERYG